MILVPVLSRECGNLTPIIVSFKGIHWFLPEASVDWFGLVAWIGGWFDPPGSCRRYMGNDPYPPDHQSRPPISGMLTLLATRKTNKQQLPNHQSKPPPPKTRTKKQTTITEKPEEKKATNQPTDRPTSPLNKKEGSPPLGSSNKKTGQRLKQTIPTTITENQINKNPTTITKQPLKKKKKKKKKKTGSRLSLGGVLGADAEARHEGELEACLLHEPRAEPVVAAGHHHQTPFFCEDISGISTRSFSEVRIRVPFFCSRF